jgi:hypothetical protein
MFLTTIGISSFINKLTIIHISTIGSNVSHSVSVEIIHVMLRVSVYGSPYIYSVDNNSISIRVTSISFLAM